jgi:hypothetical protein
MTDSGWKDTLNLPETTTRATIYCSEADKEEWDEEVEEQGYSSRSTYLYELVQEARAYREKGFLAHHQSEERIQELEDRVEQLQNQLEKAREDNQADGVHVDQPRLVLDHLHSEYQPLEQLLQEIIRSPEVKEQLRGPIEDLLYTLAEQDRVEYERGHGWKTADSGGDR